jgi:hypothetical protein
VLLGKFSFLGLVTFFSQAAPLEKDNIKREKSKIKDLLVFIIDSFIAFKKIVLKLIR